MEFIIKASAILIIFYLMYFIFLKQETFFQGNRFFLLTGIISALILPNIWIPIYIEIEPQVASVSFTTGELVASTAPTPSFDWLSLLAYLYVGVSLFLLVKFLIEISSVIRLIRKGAIERSQQFHLVQTQESVSPFSFFKWIFFNPNQFHLSELQLIINHEKVHAKQYHSLDVLIMEITCIMFWFNPVVWIYKKALKQNLEYIADHETQNESHCDKTYQKLLLKTVIKNHHMALANNFYNSLIKKRIVMLQKSKSHKLRAWKYLIILPFIMAFLMSFNTKEVYIERNLSSETTATVEASTTNQQLQRIEDQFSTSDLTFKFTDVHRGTNQLIETISVSTKKRADKKFIKKLTFNKKDGALGISSFHIRKQNDGSDISVQLNELTDSTNSNPTVLLGDNKTIGTTTNKEKLLGESPMYLVKGKISGPNTSPSKNMTTDSSITVLSKKDAVKKYGEKAKDGALIFNGNVSFQDNKTVIEVMINKDFTESDLDRVIADLKKEGVELKFKGIKRNSQGEITSIKIDAKKDRLSANYQISNSDPINPIVIQYNSSTNNISIGNRQETPKKESVYFIRKEGDKIHEIDVDVDTEEEIIIVDENGHRETIKTISASGNEPMVSKKVIEIKSGEKGTTSKHVWVTKSDDSPMVWSSDENVEVKIIDKEKAGDFYSVNTYNSNPLYLINGKEVTKEEFHKIDHKTIKSLEVLKGENAIETYGAKAKDGAINVITK